jgi:hypothetical protein
MSNNVEGYTRVVKEYYPSSTGTTKEKLLFLTQEVHASEWVGYNTACEEKL